VEQLLVSSQTLLQNYLRLHQPAAAAGDQAVVRLQVLSQWAAAAATEGTAASAGDSSQGDDADDSDVYGTVLARGGSEEAATIKVTTMPRVVG
jgi:hypothetical protein